MLNGLHQLRRLRGLATAPKAAASVSLNQTATFGALTLSGAGAFKPVDANGDTFDLTSYNSVVSGSITGYTPSISLGGLRFTGSAGAPNGAVLRCSYAGGTIDITIATVANQYSVSTKTEATSALSAIGSAGGKTIRYRRGDYGAMNDLGKFVSYVSEVVHLGEGTADTGKGTRWNTAYTTFSQNQAFENLEVYSTNTTSPLSFNSYTTGLRVTGCYLHGAYHNPQGDWTTGSNLPTAGVEIAGNMANFTVERCLMEYLTNGVLASSSGTMTIQDNEFRYLRADAMQLSASTSDKTSARTIRRNVAYGWLLDNNAHGDFCQVGLTNALDTDEFENWTWEQNVSWSSDQISPSYAQGVFIAPIGTGNGMRFKNPVFRYNVILGIHQHGITIHNINGGTFEGNTICHHDTNVEAANSTQINLGLAGTSVGAVALTRNVVEGFSLTAGPTYTQTDNVVLGAAGTTIAFSDAFNDASPTTSFTSYVNALAKRTAKTGGPVKAVNAGALGVGVATFGTPRTPGEWSIP